MKYGETVPDPKILNPRRYSQSYINGDLWLDLQLLLWLPTVQQGDIGHEFMGEIVEVGSVE